MLRKTIYAVLILAGLPMAGARAEGCTLENRACIVENLRLNADKIDTPAWRDQTYRELAKTLAFDGDTEGAIALLPKIQTPDTKAMTIRGIGMAAADNKLSPEQYGDIFTKLRVEANKIDHPPSHAIALTYIAMAQAFAGDNEGAWKTASEMENEALRHKAYGETAEIQAEKGDITSTMKSIASITSLAFRNKAYATVSKIFADSGKLDEALKMAEEIDNPYKKATSLQYILDKQKPREISHSNNENKGDIP